MAVQARSGPAKVIESGMVTCFGGQDLTLTLVDQDLHHNVTFSFKTDERVQDVAVESTQGDHELRLNLVNFDHPDGRGSATPVLLGQSDDHLYFLHFRVFRFGRTDDRTVHFTFYRATKEAVNWTPLG